MNPINTGMHTVKVVRDEDGYHVVEKLRNGHSNVWHCATKREADTLRDQVAEDTGAEPLYWSGKMYMTVPED